MGVIIKYRTQLFPLPRFRWLPLLGGDAILDKLSSELFPRETRGKLPAIFKAEKTNTNSPEEDQPESPKPAGSVPTRGLALAWRVALLGAADASPSHSHPGTPDCFHV